MNFLSWCDFKSAKQLTQWVCDGNFLHVKENSDGRHFANSSHNLYP